MKRCPRIILKLCVFVVAGVIVNVAVAWGCEYFDHGPESGTASLTTSQANYLWKSFAPWAWVDARIYAKRIVYDTTVIDELALDGGNDFRVLHVIRSGWPYMSMCGAILRYYGPKTLRPDDYIDLVEWIKLERLPLRPLWPGFAINTVFYAAILWLLWLAPGFVRRRVRSMRGRCRACGYSLHNRAPDSTRCPECGATV